MWSVFSYLEVPWSHLVECLGSQRLAAHILDVLFVLPDELLHFFHRVTLFGQTACDEFKYELDHLRIRFVRAPA